MKRFVWLFALALLIAGCGKEEAGRAVGGYAAAEAPASMDMDAGSSTTAHAESRVGSEMGGVQMKLASSPTQDASLNQAAAARAARRAVIRNGSITVRVKSVEESEKKVGKLVRELGGYVASTNSTDLESETPTLNLSLRVPAETFESTMVDLEALGTRMSMHTSTEDVTAQLVDLDARLKIMRAQEDAFRNMLKKATGQQEIMDIQTRVMELRSQIESLAQQQKSLSELSALSKIELTLVQSAIGAATSGDQNWSQEAWGSATTTLGKVARGLGTAGIWLLLFAPLWLPAVLLIRWALRNGRRIPVEG